MSYRLGVETRKFGINQVDKGSHRKKITRLKVSRVSAFHKEYSHQIRNKSNLTVVSLQLKNFEKYVVQSLLLE